MLQTLIEGGHDVYLTITGDGLAILNDETGLVLKGSETDIQNTLEKHLGAKEGQLRYFDEDNMYSPIASGSAKVDGMVVIPCSMKALSAIANGFASNFVERAADVTIKEKRKLIIVPREMPLSSIHLRNMLIPVRNRLPHHPGHAGILPPSEKASGHDRLCRGQGARRAGGGERADAEVGTVT